MPRYRFTVEYDGSAYNGFQAQTDQPTVQGAIETAITAFSGERVRIAAAGRTDTGVHATGQTKLQGYNRGPGRRKRAHLHKAGHNAKLPFQRRSDDRGHHIGRSAGVQGLHLNGGIVYLRQGRHGQVSVAQQP